jgi:cellulose synthase operon protein C
MRDEIDRLVGVLEAEVLRGVRVEELRTVYTSRPETRAIVLRALLNLAAGYLSLGEQDRAEPILHEARTELLNPPPAKLSPQDYTLVARSYISAVAMAPSESGLTRIIELYRAIPPRMITNTWKTAPYYSRFHLELVEDTVLAVCRMDFAAPHVVSAGSP